MRILWFANSSPNFKQSNNIYNGGGWISSLEKEIKKIPNISLGIGVLMNGDTFKEEIENTMYYPIRINTKKRKIKKYWPGSYLKYEKDCWTAYEEAFLKVIEDFNPDIIQIFGSESYFGLVADKVKIPVVLHIQGILNPYLNAFLPPFISWKKYIFSFKSPHSIISRYCDMINIKCGAMREKVILQRVQNFIGRTEWDKRVTKIFNENATYFYGSEILRDAFYEEQQRNIPQKLTIVTTISQPLYKGFDLILKTALLLKTNLKLDFEWLVYGNVSFKEAEKNIHIQIKDVNVKLMGVVSADVLAKKISSATVYVHSSYIDNSPNSVCEAMILGVPTISTNVGGISSLIKDSVTGFLVPANDPFQLAYLIFQIYPDQALNIRIGNLSKTDARIRHNKENIVKDLLECYKQLLG